MAGKHNKIGSFANFNLKCMIYQCKEINIFNSSLYYIDFCNINSCKFVIPIFVNQYEARVNLKILYEKTCY